MSERFINQNSSQISPSLINSEPPENAAVEIPRNTPSKIKVTMLFLLICVFILIVIILLHINNFNFIIETTTAKSIESTTLINKKGYSTLVKSIIIRNKFITPRRIEIKHVTSCFNDIDMIKNTINLQTEAKLKRSGPFQANESIPDPSGKSVWLYPLSEMEIQYSVAGEWYDYIYQYLDYDEVVLVSTKDDPKTNTCKDIKIPDLVENIPVINASCFGCVVTKGGADLAVIDFIANDDKISENSFISFIPIIKNIGDLPSGKFEVKYYLNDNFLSSFILDNLSSGEVVNNFIAGSGFQGNFGLTTDTDMALKVMVTSLETIDLNPDNNEYLWEFQFTKEPLQKHVCTFTDDNQGPNDFLTTTSIKYDEKVFTDLCIDDNYLLEYKCDEHPAYQGDDNLDVFLYRCGNGCLNGACIQP